MSGMTQRLVLFFLSCGAIFAQAPAVSTGGIVNHFSYATPGLPNGSIAQGSIFDIFGTNIGPAELAQPSGFPLPTQLANTSVQVTVAGTTVDCILFFVSRNQIAALLPSRTPEGTGTLTVIVSGARSAPSPITVAARSLGILTLAQNGRGPAVMQMTAASGEVFLNSASRPASAGQVGVFYGTGLGRVTFDETRAAPVQNLDPPIQAFVNGQSARVLFQGRTPGLAGLDQINLEIPTGVSGCFLPVWFQTGNVISNLSTISVAAPGTSQCPDPITGSGPPTSGIIKSGSVQLVRASNLVRLLNNLEIVTDVGSAAFSAIDLSKIVQGNQTSPLTQIGPCSVGPIQQQIPTGDGGAAAITYLDAGANVTIRGPGGVKVLNKAGPTGYSTILGMTPIPNAPAQPAPYLVPGVYTAEIPGSGEVPAFNVSLTLPNPEFAWTNSAPQVNVTRAAGLEITWSGGDATGWVDIAGTSNLPRVGNNPGGGGLFSCRFPANLGRARIGPEILLHLPPTFLQSNGDPSGVLSVNHTITGTPLPLPSEYILPVFGYAVGIARVAQFN